MIARGVHHVSYSVADLERSRRFYEGVLGLETIPRPEMGLPGVWYSAGGHGEVHLIERPEGAEVGRAPGALNPLANHQAFEIEDYAKTLEWLESRGVEVLKTSPERGQMWILDPDGHVIELIRPASRT